MRYSDVSASLLRVPTRAAFVAMKAFAWADRRLARDLYDLWGLASAGFVDREAAAVFHDCTGTRLHASMVGRPPADDWVTALGHQTAVLPPVEEALRTVREVFAALDSP